MIVFLAGTRWDGIAIHDHRLAHALGRRTEVLWVDPPTSLLRRTSNADRIGRPAVPVEVADGVRRLRLIGPPALTKPVISSITNAMLGWAVRRAVTLLASPVDGIIVASGNVTFPARLHGRRLFYVTDDWLAGAALLGVPRWQIERRVRRNLLNADVVAAVSVPLADQLSANLEPGRRVLVIPNGCEPTMFEAVRREADTAGNRSAVGLVGQLNERLDLDVLEAVAATGTDLLVVGPRTERDRSFAQRLDRFLAAPNVRWVGPQPYDQLPAFLAEMKVGLTPYADTEFNRGSFPLKTLEYLAAGLPVVSTDLPAVRWLGSSDIEVAATPRSFVQLVERALRRPESPEVVAARRSFVSQHSWDERAASMLDALSR